MVFPFLSGISTLLVTVIALKTAPTPWFKAMSIIYLALGRKWAQLGGSYSEFFRKLHQIAAGWRHPEGFLLTYLGSGLGLFKKLGGRTAGVSQASLLSVVSLHDLSTWPLHSSQASNMAGKGSQRRYPKRNQQKRPGFLP